MTARNFVLVVVLLGLGACASGPEIDHERYDQVITPQQVADNIQIHRGREVLWGGLIVGVKNFSSGGELEILGYPLIRGAWPDVLSPPTSRFIARSNEFIEPLEYAPGKQVTVVGKVVDVTRALIGEAAYRYPVVSPDSLYLWSGSATWQRPQVGFGVGVGFGW